MGKKSEVDEGGNLVPKYLGQLLHLWPPFGNVDSLTIITSSRCIGGICPMKTLAIEIFRNRRWRLYQHKRKAVAFISNPPKLYRTCMALFYTCFTFGPFQLFISFYLELHAFGFTLHKFVFNSRPHVWVLFSFRRSSDLERFSLPTKRRDWSAKTT